MIELILGKIFPNKLSNYTTKLKNINALYLLFFFTVFYDKHNKTNHKDVCAIKEFHFDDDKEYEAKLNLID